MHYLNDIDVVGEGRDRYLVGALTEVADGTRNDSDRKTRNQRSANEFGSECHVLIVVANKWKDNKWECVELWAEQKR